MHLRMEGKGCGTNRTVVTEGASPGGRLGDFAEDESTADGLGCHAFATCDGPVVASEETRLVQGFSCRGSKVN